MSNTFEIWNMEWVFQRFSTLNALSNGRDGIILEHGSFGESHTLFGFDGADYDLLFEETVVRERCFSPPCRFRQIMAKREHGPYRTSVMMIDAALQHPQGGR